MYKNSDEWKKIQSKKKTYKTYATGWWWIGFDDNGQQKWFIELNNGSIISPSSSDYGQWRYKILLKAN